MIATKGSQATKLLRFGANLVKNEELLSVAQKNAVRCIASSTSFSSGSIPNAASNTSPQQVFHFPQHVGISQMKTAFLPLKPHLSPTHTKNMLFLPQSITNNSSHRLFPPLS